MKLVVDIIKEFDASLSNTELISIMDEGDVGNLIGTVIARHLDKEGIKAFLNGLEHGVSLTTGSHDSADIEHYNFLIKVDTPEQRKTHKERVKLFNFGG